MRAPIPIPRLAAAAAVVAAVACATNPATGRRDLMLVSEEQEIALGRQEDARATASYGEYPERALREYVAALGSKLAERSERPQLPWSFRVADDAAVNAFAAPGGFLFVTRGILAHLDSEAELVMVLGHEVGHVTARHLARQLSTQQLASLGLGVGMVLVPELQRYGGLGQAGLGLLFLKFGRDDEREADELGLRYSLRLDYDPAQGARAFRMLDQLAQRSPGGRMPAWLSTHPDPGDRYRSLVAAIQSRGLKGSLVGREGYLKRLDGLAYGDDPREGFFRGQTFYHPGMRFRLALPPGYKGQNTKQAVLGASPDGDAVVQLTLAKESTPEAAARAFLSANGLAGSGGRAADFGGLPGVLVGFEGVSGQTRLRGVAAFVRHEDRTFRLLGYAAAADWARVGDTLGRAVTSFAPLRESWALQAEPRRIAVVSPERDMTLAEFGARYPSTVPDATVALLNGLEPGGTLKAGQLAKRVVGGRGLEPGPDRVD
jgi:predicted Zn-dependent protease